MLTLTRPNRQVLATLAIVAFLVAPTGYVAVTAYRIHRPGYVRELERDLGRELGLQVSLAGVAYPRPGMIVYRGVVLQLEEPVRKGSRLTEVARAELVWLRRDGRQVTLMTDGLRLRAQSPTLALAQVGALWQRAGGSGLDQVGLTAGTCEVDLGPGLRYTLRDLAGSFRADRKAPTVTFSYRVVEGQAAPRCELTLTRDRSGDAVWTAVALRTADGVSLAARVLDPFFGAAAWLGPDARIEGELALNQDGATGTWQARFRGTLSDVDLAALIGQVAPEHRLSGRARVTVESARWADQPGRGPGWVEARGALTSVGGGVIGTRFLRALQEQLKFRLSDRINLARPDQEYLALGLTFAFGPDGQIRLGGGLGEEFLPGAVLVHGQRFAPLAYAPDGAATVPGLIRTLVPGNASRPDQLIPARLESLVIQRYLPAPPPVSEAPLPSAKAN